MKATPSSIQASDRRNLAIILGMGLLALLPLVIFHRQFGQLFWFGDDWDQLDQIQNIGFWSWTWQVFAENFVPLYKLLWGGCVYLFGGSYFGMIVVLWLTHALNTIQLGRLLHLYGFPLGAVLACQIVFGLTPGNLETLGWATQWSAVLATSFLLFSLEWIQRVRPFASPSTGAEWRAVAVVVLLSAASALTFSRGVLTGGLLGLACFWPTGNSMTFTRRSIYAVLFLLPAITSAALIMAFASGNHQHLAGHLLDAADYGLWYFCMNPFYRLVEMDSWGLRTIALLGTIKVAVIAWALFRAETQPRRLLVLLLLFDLSNAALLGIGRYHTGLSTTISSRYQYGSLIAILPFAALCLNDVLQRLWLDQRRRALITACVLVLITAFISHNWQRDINAFSDSRGTATRRVLSDAHPAETNAIPGIPSLTTSHAKELVVVYHLK